MDTPSFIHGWDVLNIPKKMGFPKSSIPNPRALSRSACPHSWDHEAGSESASFGILPLAPHGNSGMTLDPLILVLGGNREFCSPHLLWPGKTCFLWRKKCETEGKKRGKQLLMNSLECFLAVIIPCLFRQHLPMDTLQIIIIIIIIITIIIIIII